MPTYLKVVVPTYFWCQWPSARVFWWSAFLKPLCKNQFQFLKLQWQTQLPKMKICLFLIIAVFCVQDVWGSVGLILLWIYKCIHISKSSSARYRWKWNMLGLPIIFHRGSFTRTTTLRSYPRSNNWLCCWRPQHLGFHKAFQKKKRCRWKWKIIWRILDCKGFETRRVMEIFHWWHILSTKKWNKLGLKSFANWIASTLFHPKCLISIFDIFYNFLSSIQKVTYLTASYRFSKSF